MKTITFRQFIDAIEQNGLPQAYSTWFTTKDVPDGTDDELWRPSKKEITSACAIGQAAINLGLDLYSLRHDNYYGDFGGVIGIIETWNDDERYSFAKIAARAREEWSEYLDNEFGTFEEREY